jgi:hypothetical protein
MPPLPKPAAEIPPSGAEPRAGDAARAAPRPGEAAPPREIGGREGPEPTRYGDWEKAGRCIDF